MPNGEEIERAIQELLALGHMRSGTSLFASSLVLVKSKDRSLHMCIDYWALKKKMLKNQYNIPRIVKMMDELRGSKYSLRYIYAQDTIRLGCVSRILWRQHSGSNMGILSSRRWLSDSPILPSYFSLEWTACFASTSVDLSCCSYLGHCGSFI